MSDKELLYFNGINGATGDYELPPMTAEDIAAFALGEPADKETKTTLKIRHDSSQPPFGVNADSRKLHKVGWAVVFAGKDKEAPAIREALQPLLDWRKEQASKEDERCYREFMRGEGYRPGDSHLDWLGREPRSVGPGPVDPIQMPYYILLVGKPDREEGIPYRFQYQLDVQYAVGRIHFDTLEEYAQYAQSVVAVEKLGEVKLPRQMSFFGVKNEDDRATILSSEEMIAPLSEYVTNKWADWEFDTLLADQASKSNLSALLGGDQTPAFLFTASHGMGFPNGHERQLRHQGALLCSDWPGPREWREPIPEGFYFSGDDVGSDARLLGMMAFFFACYGAGTPQLDDFSHKALTERQQLAPYAFLAGLPRRLLSHPKGGALAVVGHVERAWGYSFMWSDAGSQLQVFKNALDQLMAGYPIGAAMEWFDERHAELSMTLTSEIEEVNVWDHERDDAKLSRLWTANKDARSYVIIGDPAVRIPYARPDEDPTARLELEAVTISVSSRAEDATIGFEDAASDKAALGESEHLGLFGGGKDGDDSEGLFDAFKQVANDLAATLRKALDDVSSLEIVTYTASDLDVVQYDHSSGQFAGQLERRALTRVSFDGDTQVCLPVREDGKVDRELWDMHLEIVKEAQANRAKFIETMADLAVRLAGR